VPILRASLSALLLAAVAACSGSTTTRVGDLGRPVDLVNTGAIPERYIVEPGAKGFNRTDEEERMADRVWRFLHAPHVTGWFIPRLPREPVAGRDDPARYYRWLQKTNYRSSEVRYNTVAGDVHADVLTLPDTFTAICAVETIDDRRALALAELGPLEPGIADRVAQRRADNSATIASFVVAVRYRYESYGYALDNLLVETPHANAREVDAVLSDLARFVARAEAADFCERPSPVLVLAK
jgi:hypothetical protein